MVGFLNVPELYDDEFDPEHHFLVGGGDDSAAAIREASVEVNPYSAMLDASFRDYMVFDGPDAVDDIDLLLGDTSLQWDLPVIYLGAGLISPSNTRPIGEAYDVGEVPEPHSVWYVGARSFTRNERDWARHNQRFLPLHDVDISVGLCTAIGELNHSPFRLMLNVDVIDAVWTPAVHHPASLGVSPRELWQALKVLDGTEAAVIQVCGVKAGAEAASQAVAQTARVAAEFARDICLRVWQNKKPSLS